MNQQGKASSQLAEGLCARLLELDESCSGGGLGQDDLLEAPLLQAAIASATHELLGRRLLQEQPCKLLSHCG